MKLVKSLALVIGLICVAYFVGATVYNITYDSDRNGTPEFRVDTDGNTEIAGTLAVTGVPTFTTGIDIGSVSAIPTTGYGAGSIVFYTGSESGWTTAKFYGSTATVNDVSDWVALH